MSKSRPYNRPNRKWACGRLKEGCPCKGGPSESGHCEPADECKPSKKGDHYKCSRPLQFGGACEEGPSSTGECCRKKVLCTPVRSIRHRRFGLTLSVFGLSLGLLLMLLTKATPDHDFFSPGELSSHHRSHEHNCASCHASAHGTVFEWLGNSETPAQQAEACLACHKLGPDAMLPHGNGSLGQHADQHKAAGTTSCRNCHSLHKGLANDLNQLGPEKCQSCHEKKFESFAQGHPEFSSYPFNTKQRIKFDHIAHFEDNFPKTNAKVSCQTCHAISDGGGIMEVKSFEASCMQCHGNEIQGDGVAQKGIAFLNLPGLDLQVLKKRNIQIGDWPEQAHLPLSEFSKLLIHSDIRLAAIYEDIKNLDLTDLDEATPEQLKQVEAFVWGYKEFLFDVMDDEAGDFKRRVEIIFDKKIGDAQIGELVSSLPIGVLKSAMKRWIASLSIEVEQKRRGFGYKTRATKTTEFINEDDEDWMRLGGWYRSDEDFTIKYRPSGHGDRFITSWLALTGEQARTQKHMQPAFGLLAHDNGAGKCMKCHSVKRLASGALTVQWQGRKEGNSPKRLIKFPHGSHMALIKDKGCLTCHQMNPDGDMTHKTKKGRSLYGNFKNIKKETCAQCHTKSQVSDDCLGCHNYHMDTEDSAARLMKELKTTIR